MFLLDRHDGYFPEYTEVLLRLLSNEPSEGPEVTKSAGCRTYIQSSINSNPLLCIFNATGVGRPCDPSYFPLHLGCWEAHTKLSPSHGRSYYFSYRGQLQDLGKAGGLCKTQSECTCIEWMNPDFPGSLKVVDMHLTLNTPRFCSQEGMGSRGHMLVPLPSCLLRLFLSLAVRALCPPLSKGKRFPFSSASPLTASL